MIAFRRVLPICLALAISTGGAARGSGDWHPAMPPVDLGEAMALCDVMALQPAEGVWELPSENMLVMVARAKASDGNYTLPKYVITVVDTPDVSLNPGDTIGWMESSAEARKFSMSLYTKRNLSSLIRPVRLLAELNSDESMFKLKAEKWRLKIGSLPFMRNFWRIVKLQHDDPLKNLPVPMIKVYPADIRLQSSPQTVRYL